MCIPIILDEYLYVFLEKTIYSSHEMTTGGRWCYINAHSISHLVLRVLQALPFTIDSLLLKNKSAANQRGPAGYQCSYGVSVIWHEVDYLFQQHTHTCILVTVLGFSEQKQLYKHSIQGLTPFLTFAFLCLYFQKKNIGQ